MLVGLDFETENDEQGNCKPLICALNAKNFERVYDFSSRKEYVSFIYELMTSGDTYVVFNASFDIEIIMIMLLKNKFKFLSNEDNPSHKTMKLIMGQKIYSLSTYYSIEGRLVETTYIDLGNLIVGTDLRTIAEKFTDLSKGNLEEAKKDDKRFKEYCMLDAKIARVAYENISEILGGRYITIGSAAFNIMLSMSFKGKTKKERFKRFKQVFGDNSLEYDKYLRKWYAGGLGWCSTDERTEVSINSYDLKSAYPAESMKNLPTTQGKRTYIGYQEPNEEFPFAFIHMKVTGQVREDTVPVLPSRNIYGDSNVYIYDDKDVYIIQEYGKISEYEYFMENVEIDSMEYIETILMRNASMNPLKPYMEKFYKMKKEEVGIKREFAKRLLNSLTGKLGTNPIKENIKFKLDPLNKLVRDSVEETEIDVYVTQVVAVITSRVRCKCYAADKVLRGKVSFRLYATDSVKHTSNVKIIPEGKELGDWALEHEDTDFIFLGLKAYIFDAYNKKGEREVMCAGISKKYKPLITNEQFFAKTKVKSLISERSGNGRIIYEGYKHIVTPIRKPRRRENAK